MATRQTDLFADIAPGPDLPPSRVVCTKCGGVVIVNPERTVDARWAFGHCPACRKRRIFEVHTSLN